MSSSISPTHLSTSILCSGWKTLAEEWKQNKSQKKINTHQLGSVGSKWHNAHKHGVGVTVPDFLWELSVGDQKAGDVVGVEETDEAVDFRVHDRLAH